VHIVRSMRSACFPPGVWHSSRACIILRGQWAPVAIVPAEAVCQNSTCQRRYY